MEISERNPETGSREKEKEEKKGVKSFKISAWKRKTKERIRFTDYYGQIISYD